MTGRRAGLGYTPLGRDRSFDITLKLLPTRERFSLKDVHNDLKISELQNDAEFATGIPMYMQVLTYLDEGKYKVAHTIDTTLHTPVMHNHTNAQMLN